MTPVREAPYIAKVILWTNGIVAVFDQYGQQMPEYQGRAEEVARKIHRVYKAPWEVHDWGTEIVPFLGSRDDANDHAARDRLRDL